MPCAVIALPTEETISVKASPILGVENDFRSQFLAREAELFGENKTHKHRCQDKHAQRWMRITMTVERVQLETFAVDETLLIT